MLTNFITKNLKQLLVGVVITQLFLMHTVQANIFKCTNVKGAVYYNDKPCPVKDKSKKMKAEKDVKNGYVPKQNTAQSDKKATPKKAALKAGKKNNPVTVKKVTKKKPADQYSQEIADEILFVDSHAGEGTEESFKLDNNSSK